MAQPSIDLKTLREKARKGPLSLEETRLFVQAARKSYLAAEQKKGPAKSRVKTPKPENEDDREVF